MKVGKVPESVLKRSIIKQLKTKRPEIIQGAAVGEDCAVVALEEGEVYVMSVDPITGTSHDMGYLAINITANDIASSGAEIIGVMITLLLPVETEESDIKEIMKQVEEACSELNIQVMGGHTEITCVVNQPVITVTGVGKTKKESFITTGGVKPGDDIVITKWIGLEGTAIIAREKEEELSSRFPAAFVDRAKDFIKYLSVVPEAAVAVKHGVNAMHDVTEGGIFGALWEIAEASKVGLEIDLKSIPVKQETIEICELFGLNPYELISSGSMLIATQRGSDLVRELEKANINAAVVGKATAGNDRVLINGEERRFLEPPKTDELYKIY